MAGPTTAGERPLHALQRDVGWQTRLGVRRAAFLLRDSGDPRVKVTKPISKTKQRSIVNLEYSARRVGRELRPHAFTHEPQSAAERGTVLALLDARCL